MNSDLITPGEFAKLAVTTKRTILFYDQLGILKPVKIEPNGYRYYDQQQIINYQVIHLLRTLNIPLTQIKEYLTKNKSLRDLFIQNKPAIQREVTRLQFALNNIDRFFSNLDKTKTLVNPVIKYVKSFSVYCTDKTGPYAKIGQYCTELRNMFSKEGKNFTTLTIFSHTGGYQPKKSQFKIACFVKPNMKIKPQYLDTVKQTTIPGYKAVTYVHHGSGNLLSMFWKELEKYCVLNKIKHDYSKPEVEIYTKVNEDETKQFFEIQIPIVSSSCA